MKSQKPVYLKNAAALLILFFIALSVNAQNVPCPEVAVQNEPTTVLETIGEDDYPHFLNISGLKRYSNIKYNGLEIVSNKVGNYTLVGNGKRMKLFAMYGADGNLINGSFIKKDSLIPVFIIEHLRAYRTEDWKMAGNKTFVIDFDPLKTEYEVELQRENENRTVFFDHAGKPIKRLAHSY